MTTSTRPRTWRLLPTEPTALAWWNWLLGVAIPPGLILLFIFGATQLGTAYDVAHGGGVTATMTVRGVLCTSPYASRGLPDLDKICTGVHGPVVDTEGDVLSSDAVLDTLPEGTKVGDELTVRYRPGAKPPVAFLPGDSSEWKLIAATMACCVLGLLVWSLVAYRWASGAARTDDDGDRQ